MPTLEKRSFPTLLGDLKHKDAISLNYAELLKRTECIQITVSPEEVDNVEVATRKQADYKLWNEFRAGRITASKMKKVFSTDPANPSQSLIMSVCYPSRQNVSNSATEWGVKNEAVARRAFINKMTEEELHINLDVDECGLFISEEKPFMAATSDGIVQCDCCKPHFLEIKYPFFHRKDRLDQEFPNFYLVKSEDDKLQLNKSHEYYYQVQTQLGVAKLQTAYFVVYTEVVNMLRKFNLIIICGTRCAVEQRNSSSLLCYQSLLENFIPAFPEMTFP